jgi:2,4-dienoyl-CoA reductase-like NADH-dependent reductase (Old Yellow Enzyme family)
MSRLFTPLTVRDVTFPNRAWVSPMCQYSAVHGLVGDWHLVHLGGLAVGRPGLLMAEATAVTAEGRISVACPGIWLGEQADAWGHVVDFVHGQGTLMGLQLAHAGRKASTSAPWHGGGHVEPELGGWQTVAPSPISFADLPVPRELSLGEIDELVDAFAQAAQRADDAGFDVVEIHMAHGYLLHEFLSPISNRRTDGYGGSLENRMRLPLQVARAVRAAWPSGKPLFVRISTTDWAPGGWDVAQSVSFTRALKEVGVDLLDASSGGLTPEQVIPREVDYQVRNAAIIRAETGIAVAAVGLITDPRQAEAILKLGQADAVMLARQMLRDPHWPLRAAHELGDELAWVPQYTRAATWPA